MVRSRWKVVGRGRQIVRPALGELKSDARPEPAFDSRLFATCHPLRKKPIGEFTTDDLRILRGQSIGKYRREHDQSSIAGE
ncbi:MAG: contact-dependent growth inhibition system immunity protein [Planctomycetota bacterium]